MDCCCCFSVAQLCPTLRNPMDCSTPGLPVPYHLLEFAQTHVHWVGGAIQPSHPLPTPSPPVFNLSQHQDLSQWVSSGGQSIGASGSTSVLPMNIQGLFPLGLAWSLCSPRDSEESFSAPQFENINSSWFRRGMSSDETTSHSLLVTACVRTDFLPNIFVVRREEVYKLTW